MSEEPKKSGRGGRRPGAGRKKKNHVPPSQVAGLDLTSALAMPPPEEIDGVAQLHARTAIAALVKQITFGASEAAKVAACNAILDRGYGKPAVEIGGDGAAMLPFMTAPQKAVTLSAEIRTEARRYAYLAIEVLKKIADSATSESARVSASKSLLDRGLGTVAPARMPEEMSKPLGKKEMAQEAARMSATGKFATPTPPRTVQ